MISIAQSYANTIMGVSRSGLDKALIVRKLWECCAIPSFLYGVEAMLISKTTIEKLEMVQSQVARVILQLPRSASKVSGFTDAGLVPIADRIKERTGLYAWDLVNKRKDSLLKDVFASVMRSGDDPWGVSVTRIGSIGAGQGLFVRRKAAAKRVLREDSIKNVRALKLEHTSLVCMPDPRVWFQLQDHVTDDSLSKLLNMVRVGDVGLGNRRPNDLGYSYKLCPVCLDQEEMFLLCEAHVLLACQATDFVRRSSGLLAYSESMRQGGIVAQNKILKAYLGGDGAGAAVLLKRAKTMRQGFDSWFQQVANL